MIKITSKKGGKLTSLSLNFLVISSQFRNRAPVLLYYHASNNTKEHKMFGDQTKSERRDKFLTNAVIPYNNHLSIMSVL